MVFEAVLLKIDNFTTTHLRDMVQKWVLTGPDILISGQTYKVNPLCSIKVEVLGDTYCEVITESVLPTETSVSKHIPPSGVTGITIGTMSFIVLTVVLIAIYSYHHYGRFGAHRKLKEWKDTLRYIIDAVYSDV